MHNSTNWIIDKIHYDKLINGRFVITDPYSAILMLHINFWYIVESKQLELELLDSYGAIIDRIKYYEQCDLTIDNCIKYFNSSEQELRDLIINIIDKFGPEKDYIYAGEYKEINRDDK